MKRLSLLPVTIAALLVSCMTGGPDKPRLREIVQYSTIAKSTSEGKRSIEGRLLLKPPTDSGYIEAIILTASGNEMEAKWPDWAKKTAEIDPLQNYNIALLTRIYTRPDYVFNDVLRVTKDNQLIIDASICHLHNISMQRQIENGMSAVDYPNWFFAHQQKSFPHDGNAYLRCGSGISHPTWKCAECSLAYHAWAKRHGID